MSLVAREDGIFYKGYMVHAVWLRQFIEVWTLSKPNNDALADRLEEDQSSFDFQYYLVQPEGKYGYEGQRCKSVDEAKIWIDGQNKLSSGDFSIA